MFTHFCNTTHFKAAISSLPVDTCFQLKFLHIAPFKGVIGHVGKYANVLYCQELDEKIHAPLMSARFRCISRQLQLSLARKSRVK